MEGQHSAPELWAKVTSEARAAAKVSVTATGYFFAFGCCTAVVDASSVPLAPQREPARPAQSAVRRAGSTERDRRISFSLWVGRRPVKMRLSPFLHDVSVGGPTLAAHAIRVGLGCAGTRTRG
jgi:hypothetical protein